MAFDRILCWHQCPIQVLHHMAHESLHPTKGVIVCDFLHIWQKAIKNISCIKFCCPQVVTPGKTPYTVAQRGGAILRNGGKLLAVGFGSSLFGVGLTNALTAVRAMLDPNFHPLNKPQGVLVTSAAYGSFMALSSNLRYQVIAGLVEERGIERVFRGNHNICHLLSLAVRTGNTFLGSSQWIDYLRLIGLQKDGAGH